MPYKDPEKRRKYHQEASARYRKKHPERVRQRARQWRQSHPGYSKGKRTDRRREWEKQHQRQRKAWLDQKKQDPCADCGLFFPPECMDFDHVRGKKRANVAVLQTRSKKAVEIEIKKCELVCANCHRIRTRNRGYRLDIKS
jgi:hypothetical protein